MGRLWAIIIKEFLATVRDPRARITLILPPILQLVIFGLATTLEVKNYDVGILDRSGGAASVDFLQRLAGAPDVGRVIRLRSPADLRDAIDRQRVIAAIVIDQRFDRAVAADRPATLGVVLDGRRSNAAQIVAAYLGQIAASVGSDNRATRRPPSIVRNWFNPNLDYLWFTMPSLTAIIGAVAGLSITAQSVARERELGTFEQLMVSPLRVSEILIGKMVPPMLVGLFNATLFLVASTTIFGVPYTGSVLLFYGAVIIYLLALIGIGMLVSTLSMTQQQAFLGVFLVTVPAILLSGYASPVDNMPEWLQVISLANPVRHFLVIVEGLFLKDLPAIDVWASTWPMILIAVVTLGASSWLFRARKE
ncbi:MAG: hypothetical protein B7Y45_02910 [Sphingomonas sp. 28-66-16]|nr:MAG: hypothetical protein B7Y45_02910 [Sphingomonas sp. 28-66-16]